MSSELGAVLGIGVCEEIHGSVHLLENGKIKNPDEKHLYWRNHFDIQLVVEL